MRDIRHLALIALMAIALPSMVMAAPPQRRGDPEEVSTLKVAEEWVKLGRWCATNDLVEQAHDCREKVSTLGVEVRSLAAFDKALDKVGTQTLEDKRLDRYQTKLRSTRRKVASIYSRLAKVLAVSKDEKVRKRADDYFWKALEAAASKKGWETLLDQIEGLVRKGELADAIAICSKARRLEIPEALEERLRALEDEASVEQAVLRQAGSHPIRYWFSLPRGYNPEADRRWPVLVCVDGAGSGFEGYTNGFRKRRGDLPCILVGPCTFANTNAIKGNIRKKFQKIYDDDVIAEGAAQRLEWDEAGLLAILDDLGEAYGAQEKIYITGFSGGGNLTYRMVFKHPDRVAGAAPACANFRSYNYEQLKGKFPREALDFPLHILTGAEDPHRQWTHGKQGSPGIEVQSDWASSLLTDFRYPNVIRTLVEGMKHSPAYTQVLETLGPYIRGDKTRDVPLDPGPGSRRIGPSAMYDPRPLQLY